MRHREQGVGATKVRHREQDVGGTGFPGLGLREKTRMLAST